MIETGKNARTRLCLTATFARSVGVLWLVIAQAGCQQKMADQPSYHPLEASHLFADGRSARPSVPGTVAWEAPEFGKMLYTGRNNQLTLIGSSRATSNDSKSLGGKTLENYSTRFPFPITLDELQRGQQRYTIFCAVCHGPTGQGDGIVVERGYTRPPSYVSDNSRGLQRRGIQMSLRNVPVGYLFEVISKGYGAMADYSTQVQAHDRWDIVAYIRMLQFNQELPLDELPAAEQAAVRAALEATP
jgi:mono/diheme cytochrome c family protein